MFDIDKIVFDEIEKSNIDISNLKFKKTEGEELNCKYTFFTPKKKIKYIATLVPGAEVRFFSDREASEKFNIVQARRYLISPYFRDDIDLYHYDKETIINKLIMVINDKDSDFKSIDDLKAKKYLVYSGHYGLTDVFDYAKEKEGNVDSGFSALGRLRFMTLAYESLETKMTAKIKVIGKKDGKTVLSVIHSGKYKGFAIKGYIHGVSGEAYFNNACDPNLEEICVDWDEESLASIDGKTVPVSFYILQYNKGLVSMKQIGQMFMENDRKIEDTLNEWEQKRVKALRGSKKDKKAYYDYLEEMLGYSWKGRMKYWGYGAEVGEPCPAQYIIDRNKDYYRFDESEYTLADAKEYVQFRQKAEKEALQETEETYKKIDDARWENNIYDFD